MTTMSMQPGEHDVFTDLIAVMFGLDQDWAAGPENGGGGLDGQGGRCKHGPEEREVGE